MGGRIFGALTFSLGRDYPLLMLASLVVLSVIVVIITIKKYNKGADDFRDWSKLLFYFILGIIGILIYFLSSF